MYNSDGYVLIDLTGVDITKTNQYLNGIYNRILTVIDINKFALVINAGDLTPMAAVVHKRLNYYVINTPLYIFTINSNDIIMIEEAGEATVDVAIVPALLDGVKIADFTIGAVEGSLYAPEQQSEINDNIITDYTTWSSDKINTDLSAKAEAADVYTKAQVDTALSAKADISDLSTVATSGSYTDLSNKPTIPVLTDLIDDTTTSQDSVWSSDKTAAEIAAGAGVTIDDTTTSLTKTWSSDKINSEVSAKPSINDTTASSIAVYSSDKVDTLLSGKADTSTTYTKTEVDTALSGKQNTIPNTDAKTVTFNVTPSGGEVKAKVYNRVLYVSGYFRFSATQSANTQLLHISDVTLAMEVFESCFTDGSATLRFKLTTDGKLINENQFQANQWVSISLACLLA